MTRRGIIVWIGVSATAILSTSIIGLAGGYRLNLTPSEALGLWRIKELHRPVAVGDLVFVCPPPSAPFLEARELGYLRYGLCAGRLAPLIKTVAALPGQHVEIDANVVVDGRSVPASGIRATDGEGRPLRPFVGGIVPPGHLFLHSSFASSYDSRYFGPLPAVGLLGLARPVLTFDP